MVYIKKQDLTPYATFKINAEADHFFKFGELGELQNWLQQKPIFESVFVLGGGSNVLFTQNYSGAIIHPVFKGIEIVGEENDDVLVSFAAGEEWDKCVEWAVNNNLYGIENLSYIPGNAGAAPVQNIGAYGVELADVMVSVEGIYLENGAEFKKTKSACNFDYRYSIFKGPLKNRTVITKLVIKLSRRPHFHLGYGNVKEAAESLGELNLENIRRAIIQIRKEKLPDPKVVGNAGSFFKNPVVDRSFYEKLQKQFPTLPGYERPGTSAIKIAAGWLIEQAGWKGRSVGRAGVHDRQALVLINKGGATGEEIAGLASEIQADVFLKFGITLEPEVNIL